MDLSQVKAITIPEGSVKSISVNGTTIWSSGTTPSTRTYFVNDTIDCSDLTKFPKYNTDGYKRPVWTFYGSLVWNNFVSVIQTAQNNGKTVHCKLFKNNVQLIDWTNTDLFYVSNGGYVVFSDLSNPTTQSVDRVYISHTIGNTTLSNNKLTSTFYINNVEQFQNTLTSSDTITCQIYYDN